MAWEKLPVSNNSGKFEGKVTLIIPFRNEEKNLQELFLSLKQIQSSNLEIILVDDQSEDDSWKISESMKGKITGLRLLGSDGVGKKAALDLGIRTSEGEIILTTDADCSFSSGWVSIMTEPFSNTKVQLVAGPVLTPKKSDSFFQSFQQADWSSILLLTAFGFKEQKPLMCSGANLAFRKSAFEEVRGYEGNENILSGDDEFLLKKISKHFGPKSCYYSASKKNLVITSPISSWSELFNQRIRWASKWKSHGLNFHLLSSTLSFLSQVVWVLSFLLLFKGPMGLLCFSLIWLVKVGSEKQVLGSVLRTFDQKISWFGWIGTSLIHPIYVIFVVIGAIRGKFIWKGRSN